VTRQQDCNAVVVGEANRPDAETRSGTHPDMTSLEIGRLPHALRDIAMIRKRTQEVAPRLVARPSRHRVKRDEPGHAYRGTQHLS
jgi:hypothetical protein